MFNAPIYYEEIVSSTMDISRKLAAKREPHGTIVVAEFQKNGRGRGQGRSWQTEKGKSLLFTVLLRYPKMKDIPAALTLRTGLAAAQAIEEFEPKLINKIKIKWPNDILIREQGTGNREQCFKKAAGILCEADGGTVHVGIGVNVAQKDFPAELKNKATSIALAASKNIESKKRKDLLKIILKNLYNELTVNSTNDWKLRLEQRLYKKGEQVTFIEGAADSGKEIIGILKGVGSGGEIIIDDRSYITGELLLNSC